MSQKIKAKRADKRGGARKGTGPKAKALVYNEEFKAAMREAEIRLIEKHGRTVHDVMLDLLYDQDKKNLGAMASIYKIYCESLGVKSSIRKIDITDQRQNAPQIGLPPLVKTAEEEFESRPIKDMQ